MAIAFTKLNNIRHLCLRFLLILLVLPLASLAQNPKTEIRAVWVATVSNLDWPKSTDMNEQQSSMKALLDSAVAWNLNTIFFQIRPQSDAFYESTLVPWSEYVSGARGTSPGYDPLLFAINEAHKRGLELHGWLNPYRYETFPGKNDGKPGDFNATNPEWMLEYYDNDADPDLDDRIFNPGVPEVQQHLKEVVGEIINNYDIDGIHFDDYFYPYSGTSDEDIETFNTYGGGFIDIGDWRRNNINQLISSINDTILSVKPHVRFGISPFGIYGNGQNPPGITGLDAYNTIYTDPLQWLSSGNIDYLCPQLYWPIGGDQDFGTLLPWWAQHGFDNNRHVIAGHGIYRYDNTPPSARTASSNLHELKEYFDTSTLGSRLTGSGWPLNQVSLQIDIVRENRNINALGSAFFRYQDFIRVEGLADYIVTANYGDAALMPPMTWKNSTLPNSPSNIHWEVDGNGISYLTWDVTDPDNRYVLYASVTDAPAAEFLDDPANMVKVLYNNTFYFDGETEITGKPHLFFTTYDRYGNESITASLFSVDLPSSQSTLISPSNMAVAQPNNFDFSWTSATDAQSYKIEISSIADFLSVDFLSTLSATVVNATEFALLGNHQYFWRITPINFAGEGPVSNVFSFTTGFPANPNLISPTHNQQLVDLSPLIQWTEDQMANGIKLQIARGGGQFEEFNIIIDEDLGAVSEFQVTDVLNEWTTHYLRLKFINGLGESDWTSATFKTLMVLPQAPVLYLPLLDKQYIEGEIVEAEWGKTARATGYFTELSKDVDRLDLVESKQFYSVNDTTTTYQDLLPGTYYFNVTGNNIGGVGEWSQVSFSVEEVLGVERVSKENKLLFVTYTQDGRVRVRLKTEGRTQYNLRMYDIFGRKLSIPTPLNSTQNEKIYELNRHVVSGFGLIVLETESTIEYVKFRVN